MAKAEWITCTFEDLLLQNPFLNKMQTVSCLYDTAGSLEAENEYENNVTVLLRTF